MARAYADENNIMFMETSAKTAHNVNELFVAIARKLPKGPGAYRWVCFLTPYSNSSAFSTSDLVWFIILYSAAAGGAQPKVESVVLDPDASDAEKGGCCK